MRYARAPSESLLRSLETGLLRPVRQPLFVVVEGRRVPLDPHFREGDVVDLYAGQSVVLSLRHRADGSVTASAHATYAAQPASSGCLRTYGADEAEAFASALGQYLGAVVVADRWVRREGRVQLRYMVRDADAVGAPPFLPIDREVVLGRGESPSNAEDSEDRVYREALDAVGWFAFRAGWSEPSARSEANEIDQLAVDASGARLVLLELKPRDGGGAFYAPLQVLRYLRAWHRALRDEGTELVSNIEALGRARAKVGFGPAMPRLAPKPALLPVVAFDELPTRETLARLREVIGVLAPFGADVGFDALELWCWPDGDPPRRITAEELSVPRRLRRCRACGSTEVVRIVHGEPTEEAEAAATRGEVALGGCLVWEGQPNWVCRRCGVQR